MELLRSFVRGWLCFTAGFSLDEHDGHSSTPVKKPSSTDVNLLPPAPFASFSRMVSDITVTNGEDHHGQEATVDSERINTEMTETVQWTDGLDREKMSEMLEVNASSSPFPSVRFTVRYFTLFTIDEGDELEEDDEMEDLVRADARESETMDMEFNTECGSVFSQEVFLQAMEAMMAMETESTASSPVFYGGRLPPIPEEEKEENEAKEKIVTLKDLILRCPATSRREQRAAGRPGAARVFRRIAGCFS